MSKRRGPGVSDEERRYFAHARRVLLPMLRGSHAYLGICPAEVDVKFALELGLAILLDKPLIFLVLRGRTLPEKLRRVADAVVEMDDLDDPASRGRLAAVLQEFTG
ncbi:MAG TPA: hypothetical protein VG370_34760 [Chloroflexota bacterium]|nr:hypothetical protein [Chloroflexota bacterium]